MAKNKEKEVITTSKKVMKKYGEMKKEFNYKPDDLFFELTIPEGLSKKEESKFIRQVSKYISEKYMTQLQSGIAVHIGVKDGGIKNERN